MERSVRLDNVRNAKIECPVCQKFYSVILTHPKNQEKYPFPILLMHTSSWGEQEVHTMLAYIDKKLRCRHVELIKGKNVMITPFIIYNPQLLRMYTYRTDD